MPKYHEWNAQEAQEEEYLRLKHLDDEYWYARFQQEEQLRKSSPAVIGLAINSNHDVFAVLGLSQKDMRQRAVEHGLKVMYSFEPKQVI